RPPVPFPAYPCLTYLSLPPPFAAMPRQNLSFIDDRLPISYSERPKWSALLRAIVYNSLLHSSLIQELMHKILWQYLVVNHERKPCAPTIETRTMPHNTALRRRDCYGPRIDFEIGRKRFAVAIANGNFDFGYSNGSRHDESRRFTRSFHFMISASCANRAKQPSAGDVEETLVGSIDYFCSFFSWCSPRNGHSASGFPAFAFCVLSEPMLQ